MDLTIVIPTHNRHENLIKSLKYYSKWDCNVFILDSSDKPLHFDSSHNLEYIHTPGVSFTRKIYNGLCKVKTSYVCLCADDDYLAYNGVSDGIHFLNHNLDYVSVQGKYVQFSLIRGHLFSYPLYNTLLPGMHIFSENIKERLFQAARNGMQQLYSMHRINVLKETFFIVDDLFSFAEFNSNLVPMLYGKHFILESFWMARDALEHSDYKKNTWGKNSNGKISYLNYLSQFLKNDKYGQIYKEKFIQTLNRFSQFDFHQSQLIFDEIYFNIYLNGAYLNKKINHSFNLYNNIRKCMLDFTSIFIPNIIFNIKKRTNSFPYLLDSNSNNDWEIIKKHLLTK
jgi:glycosyltransferase domain-containing protein